MKVDAWLKEATDLLEQSGVGTARLDSLVLLEDVTSKDRVYILANPGLELTSIHQKKLKQQIERRRKHIPLAQIRGKTEFYGREFVINEHVLEPRPESETMIDLLKTLDLPAEPIILDVGCGSGALGITAGLEINGAQIILSDIDPGCLKIARKNTRDTSINTSILESNLLENTPLTDVILANLPYVPDSYEINRAALNEPKIAIFGGADGLDLYRRLFKQLSGLNNKPRYVLTESLPFQHKELSQIAKKAGYKHQKGSDFIQVFSIG